MFAMHLLMSNEKKKKEERRKREREREGERERDLWERTQTVKKIRKVLDSRSQRH